MEPISILGENNSAKLTISMERYQEVADRINKGETKFTAQHVIDAELNVSLSLEIANNTYKDTDQMEQIMDHVSMKYVHMHWPCFGDSDITKNEWSKRMITLGLKEDE